jgi:hypothetical protein
MFDPGSIDTVIAFVRERENVRKAKEAGQSAPWTFDPVLARNKFTNVRRKDDRVSKWVIEHLIEPGADDPDLWFTLLIARMLNWPPTLRLMLEEGVLPAGEDDFDPVAFERVVEGIKSSGQRAYTTAYMSYPTQKNKGGTKSYAMANHILRPVLERAESIRARTGKDTSTVELFTWELSGCFGVGTFMAGQVAADLTYTDKQLGRARDVYTFAPLGPGSQKGLNYLYGQVSGHRWKQELFNAKLVSVRERLISAMPELEDMTLHDVQNVMCEYSKFCRIKMSEGSGKIYRPETLF